MLFALDATHNFVLDINITIAINFFVKSINTRQCPFHLDPA